MSLDANRTTFTFNHADQMDEYGASVGDFDIVQANFDSRAEENLTDINNIKDTLRSTTDGDSGADNISATPIAELGAADTVQEQLEAIVSMGSGAIPPDGSITPEKLSFDPATQTELDTVSANLTSHTEEASHVGGLIYLYKNIGGTF